jgi:hypothetical protein
MHPLNLLFPLISVALATSFIERPLAESVQDATFVVRGTIESSHADWGKADEGTRNIYTYHQLQLMEVLKGSGLSAPGTIQVRSLGGEKDGIGMQVSGAPSFNKGEEVILFLREKNAESSYDIEGMMMGKFNIRRDESGREFLVGPGIPREEVGNKWSIDAFKKLLDTPYQAPAPGASAAPVRLVNDEHPHPANSGKSLTATPVSEVAVTRPTAPEAAPAATGFFPIFGLEWWGVAGIAGLLLLALILGIGRSRK